MNNEITDGNGQTTKTPEMADYRITQLENNFVELKSDVTDIKVMLAKLDKRLEVVPTNGLQCPLHQLRMDDFSKRIDKVEITTDSINKKVIAWSAGIAIVLFLISQLIIPYLLGHYQVASHDVNKPHVDFILPDNRTTNYIKQ